MYFTLQDIPNINRRERYISVECARDLDRPDKGFSAVSLDIQFLYSIH